MFIRFVVLCTFLACNFRRTTGTEVEMVYLKICTDDQHVSRYGQKLGW